MFELLLARVATALDEANIDYMVIGGQAVLLYGQPRHTQDIDITIGIEPSKLLLIMDLVGKLRFKILTQNPNEFVRKTMVLPVADNDTGTRIDFIFSTSEYEKIAIQRAVLVDVDKAKVKYASVEDLIIHKIIAGRPRDLEDIKSVLLKNPGYDRIYIESWLAKFEKALNINLLSSFRKLIKEIK